MITARNYAAQAELAMMLMDSEEHRLKRGEDVNHRYGAIASGLKNAVHFAVPDGGKLIDDDLRGLDGQPLKLPYEQISIEYYDEGRKIVLLVHADKEKKDEIIERINRKYFTKDEKRCGIWILECKAGIWSINPHGITYYYGATYDALECKILDLTLNLSSLLVDYFPAAIANVDSLLSEDDKKRSVDTAKKSMFVVFELIEALSCTNITTEPLEIIDPKVNARRIKAGKLPLYETKILTLKTPQAISQGQPGGGTHASPRQHLRRGHIRRLPSGNIWVNPCVVGDPSKGKIDKSYIVKR